MYQLHDTTFIYIYCQFIINIQFGLEHKIVISKRVDLFIHISNLSRFCTHRFFFSEMKITFVYTYVLQCANCICIYLLSMILYIHVDCSIKTAFEVCDNAMILIKCRQKCIFLLLPTITTTVFLSNLCYFPPLLSNRI